MSSAYFAKDLLALLERAEAHHREKGTAPETEPPVVPLPHEIGALVPGEGVYAGQYRPNNITLARVFNVYAAPEDLAEKPFTYEKTVKKIAKLKNWHGHNGLSFCSGLGYDDWTAIEDFLRNGLYKGQWVIPPVELLDGINQFGNKAEADNLRDCHDKGAFKGTFNLCALISTVNYTNFYWSCSKRPQIRTPSTWMVRFIDGKREFGGRDKLHASCRPIRLVPVKE